MWNGVHDVICDKEDIEHVRQLRKEYKNLNRKRTKIYLFSFLKSTPHDQSNPR